MMLLRAQVSMVVLAGMAVSLSWGQGMVADHRCVDINRIPQAAIDLAREQLHIAYGHTSHGSQVTDGMSGLVAFANNGGRGLELASNSFAWNNGGNNGALDLHDYAMSGDVGYWPQWRDATVAYLDNPVNADVNVILWSWCGQVTSKYTNGRLYSEYLAPMDTLEKAYSGVTFVYMTGHVDHDQDAANKAANQAIRDYCAANHKVLYDFADIECWDPDGNFYAYPADSCNYYTAEGVKLGNWALEWQASHIEGGDWYRCGAAHSQPLNANQKAYAAWWLLARLAGWGGYSDQNVDGRTDLEDVAVLATNWLGGSPTADIAPERRDGKVDTLDLGVLVENWLTGGN